MTKQIKFDDALGPTDFGFIVCGKTGNLKGLWIPTEMDEEQVPESIISLCVEYFGIDPAEFEEEEYDRPTKLH